MSGKMSNSTVEEKTSTEKTEVPQTQNRFMSSTIKYARKDTNCTASFNKTYNGGLSSLPKNGIVLSDDITVGAEAEKSTFTADLFINGKNIIKGATNESSGNF